MLELIKKQLKMEYGEHPCGNKACEGGLGHPSSSFGWGDGRTEAWRKTCKDLLTYVDHEIEKWHSIHPDLDGGGRSCGHGSSFCSGSGRPYDNKYNRSFHLKDDGGSSEHKIVQAIEYLPICHPGGKTNVDLDEELNEVLKRCSKGH